MLQSFLAATENACVALQYGLLRCVVLRNFYEVFNKLHKSVRCVTLRYLLLEIVHYPNLTPTLTLTLHVDNTASQYSGCHLCLIDGRRRREGWGRQ